MNPDMRKFVVLAGINLFIAGMIIRSQDKTIDDMQTMLREVAIDNMRLRFHIHNKEVDDNA